MDHVTVRLTHDLATQLNDAVRAKGLATPAFVRHTLLNEIRGNEPKPAKSTDDAEDRIAATLTRLAKDLRAVHAKARGKCRYEKLLISAAH